MKFRPAVFAVVFALLSPSPLAVGAPKAELWARWEKHDPESAATIDHSAWDWFLQKHLSESPDGVNRLDYGAAAGDRTGLDDYLRGLSETDAASLNRGEQLAFWINLYNALTAQVVLDHYPVATIRDIDISPGVFSSGPWGAKLIEVDGERLSLDDIEHRILRPIWRDPRIHYAVNCASAGCPNLALRAFTAENAEELLESGARDYVNHPRGARVADGALRVSSIYEWFKDDFGGDDAGVLAHLRRHADDGLRAKLSGVSEVSGDDYDWSLNDAK